MDFIFNAYRLAVWKCETFFDIHLNRIKADKKCLLPCTTLILWLSAWTAPNPFSDYIIYRSLCLMGIKTNTFYSWLRVKVFGEYLFHSGLYVCSLLSFVICVFSFFIQTFLLLFWGSRMWILYPLFTHNFASRVAQQKLVKPLKCNSLELLVPRTADANKTFICIHKFTIFLLRTFMAYEKPQNGQTC